MTHGSEPETPPPGEGRAKARNAYFALEICFLAVIGVVVVLAFFEALTYALVSSRTPFVIMAPMIILILVHGRRLWTVRGDFDALGPVRDAFAGRSEGFNKVVGFSAWMLALVAMILILGHYAGIFLFCVILMRFLAKEPWILTLAVASGCTLFIFGVFEYVFDIELYRGLIVRYFLGFRDF